MRSFITLVTALPLVLAGTSSLKICTNANFGGTCSTIDLTQRKCSKIEDPYYKHLGSAEASKTITRIYSASNCPEDKLVAMLTSPSDGKDLGAAGGKAEYVLVQECTGCP
ncbi:hypothetical protein OIDMADRAFT_26060 [Oidiodendron maius Zn]|uniref:Killer toxin Kp4 domain-containing protein n=1 Tax=Oidiodendron maius (strain Zn) TaxID=913774 RepID=A0A0C3HLX1_OIDMZ|nr:hypothetical protein OIDMADRAFT_26060 [Oidiodendron maius Zn]